MKKKDWGRLPVTNLEIAQQTRRRGLGLLLGLLALCSGCSSDPTPRIVVVETEGALASARIVRAEPGEPIEREWGCQRPLQFEVGPDREAALFYCGSSDSFDGRWRAYYLGDTPADWQFFSPCYPRPTIRTFQDNFTTKNPTEPCGSR